jgi:hypothetical protein
MSPSPELTLDSPELDEEEVQLSRSTSFPSMLPTEAAPTPGFAQSRTSPALERDEREFTQTAHTLQQIRKLELLEQLAKEQQFDLKIERADAMVLDNNYGESEKLNHDDATSMFGQVDNLIIRNPAFLASSPMMFPQRETETLERLIPPSLTLPLASEKSEVSFAWTELKSPETVELEELENLFESY